MQTVDRQVKFRDLDAILDAYLSDAPLAHALFRAAEAVYLRSVPLRHPVLDLGCGAGQFAVAALDDPLDAGVDVCPRQLDQARRTGRYRDCRLADARELPFAGGQFRTVLSVSVLEHVRDPEAVLAEAFRVLAPGGTFIATIVLSDLHQHLFYPALLRRLPLPWLGRLYTWLHDIAFRHRGLANKEVWEQRLAAAGFRVTASKQIVPPALSRRWDLLLPLALPYLVRRRLGLPGLGRPRGFRARANQMLHRLCAGQGEQGSVLFVVARKAGGKRERTAPARLAPQAAALAAGGQR